MSDGRCSASAFAGFLWSWQGRAPAEEYLAGFLIEKSLSIDNLFVFALIFGYFAVPAAYQRRVIFWGIVGAIVLRALFILAGAALLDAFHYAVYVFGAFLVLTGIRWRGRATIEIHPERNPVLRLLRARLPMTDDYDGDRLPRARRPARRDAAARGARRSSRRSTSSSRSTRSRRSSPSRARRSSSSRPTRSRCSAWAPLYFVLAGMIDRFRYLNVGLAAVLVFVGLKMLLADVWHVPVYASLAVIVAALGASIAASLLRQRAGRRPKPLTTEGGL